MPSKANLIFVHNLRLPLLLAVTGKPEKTEDGSDKAGHTWSPGCSTQTAIDGRHK